MGNKTCPAGMKLVQGATIKYPPQSHPELAKTESVADLCVDTKAVTNRQYDKFIKQKYPNDIEKRFRPIWNKKPQVRAQGVDIDIGNKYCKALGKRLPTPTEAQHIMQSKKLSYVNKPLKGSKRRAYTWTTYWNKLKQYRVGRWIHKSGQFELNWLPHDKGIRAADASFFCVAKPQKTQKK